MKITLIGLGVSEGDVTLRAKHALDGADKIIARTARTQSFKSLQGYEVQTLDDIFDTSRNFDSLNKKLAKAVLDAAKLGDVCYCVDGAVCEDEACKIILSKRKNCTVLEGVSKGAHAAALAGISGCYASVSAYSVERLKSCPAAVVYDIDSGYMASEVKAKLSDLFGEESDCAFICGENVKRIKIYELDRMSSYDYSCAAAVEERGFLDKARYDYTDLEYIIKLLRRPDGCPWDRVQTNESIKANAIEEAYELADAIERGDDDALEEETGDVLLQAAFHCVLKQEQGVFNGGDVLTRVVKKLISRHTHIFGADKAKGEGEALSVWEKNKAKEKGQSTFGDAVAAVPNNFPACMRAQKVQKRAAKSGMDFLSPVSAAESLDDELRELITAAVNGDGNAVFEEAGDVLFSAVNVCRLAGVDCEEALRAAVKKFSARFIECEKLIIADGKDITKLIGDELDWYWLQAKNALKTD